MIGFILKDLINMKKIIIIYAIIISVLIVTGMPDKDFIVGMLILGIFCQLLPLTAYAYDEQSNFDKYAITMPVKKSEIVIEKYLLNIFCVMLFVIVSSIFAGITGDFANSFKTYILILYAIEFSFSIIYPLTIKFGTLMSRISTFVLIAGGSLLASSITKNNFITSDLLNSMQIVAPIVVIALIIGSAFLSISIYNKKEFK